MSAIIAALRTIEFTIPTTILESVFKECNTFNAFSLGEMIRLRVINERVLKDIDLVQGETAYLPVMEGQILDQSNVHASVFWTDEYLQGREIMSAVTYHSSSASALNNGNNGHGAGVPFQDLSSMNQGNCCPSQYGAREGSAISKVMGQISAQNMPIIPNINSHLLLIAKNNILMRGTSLITQIDGMFEVVLSNDPLLNNLAPRSHLAFSELCVLALKSFIYKELYVKLGQAALFNGQPLSQQNSFVESLSSAEEDYQRYLTDDWSRVAWMNDTTGFKDLISSMLNPYA